MGAGGEEPKFATPIIIGDDIILLETLKDGNRYSFFGTKVMLSLDSDWRLASSHASSPANEAFSTIPSRKGKDSLKLFELSELFESFELFEVFHCL